MKLFNQARKYGAQVAAGGLAVAASTAALAESSVPSAATQFADLVSNQSGYTTVMFTLALISTGIMVGVKWIKRGKGAA